MLVNRGIEVDARSGHADEPVGERFRFGVRDRGLLSRPLQDGAHLRPQAPPVPRRALPQALLGRLGQSMNDQTGHAMLPSVAAR